MSPQENRVAALAAKPLTAPSNGVILDPMEEKRERKKTGPPRDPHAMRKIVSVRMEHEECERFKAEARRCNMGVSEWMRILVRAACPPKAGSDGSASFPG